MSLSGCLQCIKYLMFFFNFVFWILGCAILGVGIWLVVDADNVMGQISDVTTNNSPPITTESIKLMGIVMLVMGSFIMVTGFLGCCGSIQESQCLLASFFVVLFIIFVILLALGIFVLVAKDRISDEFVKVLAKDFKDNGKRAIVKSAQTTMNCCGVGGMSDQDRCDGHDNPNIVDSNKCDQPEMCRATKNCEEQLEDTISKYGNIVGIFCLCTAFIILLGMAFSMSLCCAIREGGSRSM